jgi:hypothetical protein
LKHITLAAALLLPILSFAWGAEGHKITADIAQKNLRPGIEATVMTYLDTCSFEEASVWMDDVRGNHSYDYMKTWHYVNIEKDSVYKKSATGDVVSVLDSVIAELKNYKLLTKEAVARDIKIVFHLCGDLAQPLHTGYATDKGGNNIKLTLNGKNTNLHRVWDTDIIVEEKITTDVCTTELAKWGKRQCKKVRRINPKLWMYDSRTYLAQAYDYQGTEITTAYLEKNKPVVIQQLIKGGLRIAEVLNTVFGK